MATRQRRLLIRLSIAATCLVGGGQFAPSAEPAARERAQSANHDVSGRAKPSAGDFQQDDAAIRESAATFVTAYNAHDAQTIAAGFTNDALFIVDEGHAVTGREAIARHFAEVFSQQAQTQISLHVDNVRQIVANAAVEEGTVEVRPAPGKAAVLSRYMALHVREASGWQIAWSRDFPAAEGAVPAPGNLAALGWLIGHWVSETEGAYTRIACRWSDNRRFLLQDFTIRMSGQPTLTCTSRIGWDPAKREIVSWTFNSDGSYSEGQWVAAGDKWLVKSQGATCLGEPTSATSAVKQIDADTISWDSRDRTDGPLLPSDIEPVILKRQAPPPAN